jgi:hypothetical protein
MKKSKNAASLAAVAAANAASVGSLSRGRFQGANLSNA